MNKLSLEALEVLDAIDRKGSFAAAAAALFKVPSAISYTIQKLEEQLNVTLFTKVGRRSELTPAGQYLLQEGRGLLSAAAKLEEETQQIHSGWESTLNIAVETLFETKTLYPTLNEFYALNNDVAINLSEEVLAGTWEKLINDEVDLIIGAGSPEYVQRSKELCFADYKTVTWHFVVAKNHPLCALQAPLSEKDISQYRAVVVKDSSKNLPAINRRIFENQSALKVVSIEDKIQAQLQGLGVGFLPEHRIKKYLATGELVVLPTDKATTDNKTYLVWKRYNKGKALQWFVNAFEQAE